MFFDIATNFIGLDENENPVANALPSSISNLTNLEAFNLNSNYITGELPIDTLAPLLKLRFLDFFYNELTGTIPTLLGTMKSLEYLDISQNPFEGTLPSELGLLTNLSDLRIAKSDVREFADGMCNETCINGPIPTEIGNLLALGECRIFSESAVFATYFLT